MSTPSDGTPTSRRFHVASVVMAGLLAVSMLSVVSAVGLVGPAVTPAAAAPPATTPVAATWSGTQVCTGYVSATAPAGTVSITFTVNGAGGGIGGGTPVGTPGRGGTLAGTFVASQNHRRLLVRGKLKHEARDFILRSRG